MFGFWVIASLVGLGIALVVSASMASLRIQEAKRTQVKNHLQRVADQFDGHLVERGWNGMPKLVLSHNGQRFLASFGKQGPYSTNNSCGAQSHYKCCDIDVTAEFTDPEFRMSVSANTLTSRVNGWFDKERCQTGDDDFDQKFLVVANQHNDLIEMILNRNVRHELLVGSAFYLRPMNPEPKKLEAKQPQPEKRMRSDRSDRRGRSFVLDRKSRDRSRYEVPFATTSMLNRGRVSLKIEGGQAEVKLLVHEAEYARLGEVLQSVMQAIQEIDRSFSLLNKNQKLEKV